MPPTRKLADPAIADFDQWIAAAAALHSERWARYRFDVARYGEDAAPASVPVRRALPGTARDDLRALGFLGGGAKGGMAYGATDEFGSRPWRNKSRYTISTPRFCTCSGSTVRS